MERFHFCDGHDKTENVGRAAPTYQSLISLRVSARIYILFVEVYHLWFRLIKRGLIKNRRRS